MKSNTFGLDIGQTSIKVVWLEREKNHIKYAQSLTLQAQPKGITSESPFDHQELAAMINKLVIDAKITTNNVSVALPENRVFTKVIDMPNISEKELSSAIYWEAEQYIPAPLDTITLDWCVLRKPKSTDPTAKMQVLLVAAPKQLIQRYQMILELAGLSITGVETEVLSTIRGIVFGDKFPTSILMNIGAFSTTLSIVQNGMIIFTYLVPLGGIALTRAIAADFGFSIPQAEEYKKLYGLSDKNFGGKISNAILPVLSSMVVEIKKALTFYNDRYKNESPITQVILTGGSAMLPGLSSFFVRNIGLETIIGNPWRMLGVLGVPTDIEPRGPEFAVAIGLALKEYE